MIRQTARFAALALASATLACATSAHAGGGVRLNFGGPLGTFVATPTPGYGHSTAKPKARTAKRPPVYTAAERNHPKTEARVVRVRHTANANAPKAIPVTADDNAAPGLLGRTLAVDSLPRPETVYVLPPSETIVAKDGGDVQTAAVTPAAAAQTKPKLAAAESPATCRKFIPAVSVTVTVPCD